MALKRKKKPKTRFILGSNPVEDFFAGFFVLATTFLFFLTGLLAGVFSLLAFSLFEVIGIYLWIYSKSSNYWDVKCLSNESTAKVC